MLVVVSSLVGYESDSWELILQFLNQLRNLDLMLVDILTEKINHFLAVEVLLLLGEMLVDVIKMLRYLNVASKFFGLLNVLH
jgi:hypothetical protein